MHENVARQRADLDEANVRQQLLTAIRELEQGESLDVALALELIGVADVAARSALERWASERIAQLHPHHEPEETR